VVIARPLSRGSYRDCFLPVIVPLSALADVWAWEAFLVVMPEVGDDFFIDFFDYQQLILSLHL